MMKANPLSSGFVKLLIFCLHCGAFSRFASFGIASAPKNAFLACKMGTQHVENDKPGAWWETVTALACLFKKSVWPCWSFPFLHSLFFVCWNLLSHFSSFLGFSKSFSSTLFFLCCGYRALYFYLFVILLLLQCFFDLLTFVTLWFICLCDFRSNSFNYCPASWVSVWKCQTRMKY